MVDYLEANEYITNNILHNEEFINAPQNKQEVSLRNAESQLKAYYGAGRDIPLEAVCLQAIWLLRVDDTVKRAELGVTQVSVSGISMSIGRKKSPISPDVVQLLGRRIGVKVL